MAFAYKRISTKQTVVYLMMSYIFVFILVSSFMLMDYEGYYCTNIDLSWHLETIKDLAGQPSLNQNDVCQNFRNALYPERLRYSDGYQLLPHQVVAGMATVLDIDIGFLFTFISITLLWCSVLLVFHITEVLAGQSWGILSVFLLIGYPELTLRMVTNGWFTQGILTFVVLSMIYILAWSFVRITRCSASKKESVFIWLVLFVLLTSIFAIPVLLSVHAWRVFWTDPIDRYRLLFSFAYVLVIILTLTIQKIARWKHETLDRVGF